MKKILILLTLLVFISGCCFTGDCTGEITETEKFAKFLTSEGISMAGLETCPHCLEQKEKFGEAFQYVDYYDCKNDMDWCSEHNIRKVPAWIFSDGTVYEGVRTLAELKEMTNYFAKT